VFMHRNRSYAEKRVCVRSTVPARCGIVAYSREWHSAPRRLGQSPWAMSWSSLRVSYALVEPAPKENRVAASFRLPTRNEVLAQDPVRVDLPSFHKGILP